MFLKNSVVNRVNERLFQNVAPISCETGRSFLISFGKGGETGNVSDASPVGRNMCIEQGEWLHLGEGEGRSSKRIIKGRERRDEIEKGSRWNCREW